MKRHNDEHVTVEWLSNLSTIEALERDWKASEAQGKERTIFSTYEYVMPWYRHYSGEGFERYGQPLLGICRSGNFIVALAPFVIRKGTLGKIPIRRIDMAGTNSEAGEFLFPAGQPEYIAVLLSSLNDHVAFDMVCLNGFVSGSDQFEIVKSAAAQCGWCLECSDYYYGKVDLRNGYPAYLAGLNSKRRNNIRRHAKRISALGSWRVETFRNTKSASDQPDQLSRMFGVYNASWKARTGGELADHHQQFYHDIAVNFGERDALHLSILSINERDAAFIMAVVEDGVYYDIYISYAEEFKACRPGEFLIQEVIKQLPDAGIHTLHSGGTHEYKKNWASHIVPQVQLYLFSAGLRSRLSRLMKFKVLPLTDRLRHQSHAGT